MSLKIKIYIIIIIVLTAVSGLKIDAQDNKARADTNNYMSVELGEIIIKASKENVTFRNIPASVSVVNETVISDNEIKSLNDASATIPNFFMPDYGSKLTSPVYIRGIGSRINSPSVGLYVDHVPYFEKASFDFDFFDIKRIEVLRGPQGTLFGRNTMGGIVNIITTSPLDYTGSNINLSAGTFGTYSISGGNYGRVSDKIAYSVAMNYLHNDGFYTNVFSDTKVDKLNSYGLRTRMIYEVSRKLTIENIAGIELSRQGGYPYSIYNDSLETAEEINYNQYSRYNRNLFSDAILINYSGKNINVSATTSYQYLDDLQGIDQDFTPDSLYYILQEQRQNMLSQEIIFKSSQVKKYNWLIGGYGFYQTFHNAVDADVYASKMSYLKTYDHKIKGYALFHQSSLADFPFRNLTVTAGLRLDSEIDFLHYTYDRTLTGTETLLADTIYPALRSLEIIPRFALNYKIGKSSIYTVVARGYKTGGFNSTFERPEDLTFDPEYSWNYEIGLKTPLFKKLLYTDAAIYYIDWKNQQIYQTVPSGRGSMLKNAGHSVSKGVELTLKAIFERGYEFNIAYGFTHAGFISYVVDSNTSYNGNFLPYVPRHTLALQGSRSFIINNPGVIDKIKINMLYRGNGIIFWDEENSNNQRYYGLVDGKVSFFRGLLQFDIWARNILNTEYSAFYFEALGNKYVQTGKPAHIGVNLSLKF
jgi:outer membrane receptor protein involved in Fe transport